MSNTPSPSLTCTFLSHSAFFSLPLVSEHNLPSGCLSVDASVTQLREQTLPNSTANSFLWGQWKLFSHIPFAEPDKVSKYAFQSANTALQLGTSLLTPGKLAQLPAPSVRAANNIAFNCPNALRNPHAAKPPSTRGLLEIPECAWLLGSSGLWIYRCALSRG